MEYIKKIITMIHGTGTADASKVYLLYLIYASCRPCFMSAPIFSICSRALQGPLNVGLPFVHCISCASSTYMACWGYCTEYLVQFSLFLTWGTSLLVQTPQLSLSLAYFENFVLIFKFS